MRLQNLINNEFVDPQNQKWFSHLSPATGESVCDVPDSDVMDLVRTVQTANKAWANIQKTDGGDRAQLLFAIASELRKRSSELAKVQARDEGTPEAFTLSESIPKAAEIFDHYARVVAEERVSGAAFSGALETQKLWYATRKPFGVVTIITPSTDPYVSLASRVAPALAAGNVLIVKPSEFAPECAHAFAQCVLAAHPAPGIFNLLQGRGESLGASLLQHPGLTSIAFTGSTAVGRIVQASAAEGLKRTQLSLGAKNPILVFAGVDLKKVSAAAANLTLQFHGQTCLRGSRLFVQESIYKEFLEAFKAQSERMNAQLGPLNRAEYRDRFDKAVNQAVTENGKVLFGGVSDPATQGFFVRPTAIFDLTNCSTLQQDEIIGPFVTIASFKYQHDAIKNANTNPYARAAYVFEAQSAKAVRVAQKLEAAQVFINTGEADRNENLDVSAQKESGLGHVGTKAWLEFFSRTSIVTQNLSEL